MFKWIKNLFKTQEEIEEENEHKKIHEDLYGKREGNRITYDNGCYSIVSVKKGKERLKLYSKDGKELGEYDDDEVFNWHHGFIQVTYRYSMIDFYYDCDGNLIADGDGVFIIDKEIGEDLYVIPIHGCTRYMLYNYKKRTFTSHNGGYILFDGLKGVGDVIIGTVTGLSEGSGYGTFNEQTYYDKEYTIDKSGTVLSMEKKNVRKTKEIEKDEQLEEDSDA